MWSADAWASDSWAYDPPALVVAPASSLAPEIRLTHVLFQNRFATSEAAIMGANLYSKRVADTLDYGFVYSQWLLDTDTVTLSTWASTPAGLVLSGESINAAPVVRNGEEHRIGTCTSVFAAGGVSGTDYVLSNTITTAAGRVAKLDLRLRLRA